MCGRCEPPSKLLTRGCACVGNVNFDRNRGPNDRGEVDGVALRAGGGLAHLGEPHGLAGCRNDVRTRREHRRCEGASALLPEYGFQFNFAFLEFPNKFLKGLQTTGASHQFFKIAGCLFLTLFLEKSRQSLANHFEAIAQREPIRPRNSPQYIFDLT
jgi:hypothetical protein